MRGGRGEWEGVSREERGRGGGVSGEERGEGVGWVITTLHMIVAMHAELCNLEWTVPHSLPSQGVAAAAREAARPGGSTSHQVL